MLEKDVIVIRTRELRKLQAARKVLEKEMTQKKAANLVGISVRQMRRIVKAVRDEGPKGVIHKSRGRPSNRRKPKELKERILSLYREKYEGFGPTFSCEKLLELDGIKISKETLRGWLIKDGSLKTRRKKKTHRSWRERKGHFGEMIQMDGSDHNWLEGRGPRLTLMGFVDDATGSVFGRFYEYEGTLSAMDGLKRYIGTYGIPQSIYLDKHSTYMVNRPLTTEEELIGLKRPLTQFERAAEELGVELISAHSPQAKGRIERSFKTHQDRLVKEMRLREIDNIDDANAYVEEYCRRHNAKYAVVALKPGDLHVKGAKKRDLNSILSIKHKRRLKNDNTVSYAGKLFLIKEKVDTKYITVEIKTDTTMAITSQARKLKFKQIEPRPKAFETMTLDNSRERPVVIPSSDHPWRHSKIGRKRMSVASAK